MPNIHAFTSRTSIEEYRGLGKNQFLGHINRFQEGKPLAGSKDLKKHTHTNDEFIQQLSTS